MVSNPAVQIRGLGKSYTLGLLLANGTVPLRESIVAALQCADASPYGRQPSRRDALGTEGRVFRHPARRGAWHHRAKRRGQVDSTQDYFPHYRSDRRRDEPLWPRWEFARSRTGFTRSSRVAKTSSSAARSWACVGPTFSGSSTTSSSSPTSPNFSIPRSNATPAVCTCASPSQSPHTSNPTYSSSTRLSP